MRTILLVLLYSAAYVIPFAQTPVDIVENTLKVAPQGEVVFYYGFAEGDQLIFNFEEVNGKELKELEISFAQAIHFHGLQNEEDNRQDTGYR